MFALIFVAATTFGASRDWDDYLDNETVTKLFHEGPNRTKDKTLFDRKFKEFKSAWEELESLRNAVKLNLPLKGKNIFKTQQVILKDLKALLKQCYREVEKFFYHFNVPF